MTPEQWQTIRPMLESALELDPDSRAAYLDGACADVLLRRELESLIAVHEQAGTQVFVPGAPPTLSGNDEPHFALLTGGELNESIESGTLRAGQRIGPYKIVEQIGHGGMGEVYRAIRDDQEYRHEVAIKVVQAGRGPAHFVTRFKQERQILATLDHPNIARLFDGGTADPGLSYLVMELIAGQPIDRYCDARELPVASRLQLFLQVCSAVNYAHQRLIIHRDIKPANILVTPEGIPKLLDFGIAKVLDQNVQASAQIATLTSHRFMSPGYASPEQVREEPVATASDVYSLGVVLFELLTGRSPYGARTWTPLETARAVCEVEPEKPSAVVLEKSAPAAKRPVQPGTPETNKRRCGVSCEKLSKLLRGDLDNIILMALRKEPQRRYASVESMAEDVRRYLEHLPITARQDTLRYHATKFIKRNKAGVAAAAAVVVALVLGLGISLYEAHVARLQGERAERRFNDVRKLANSLLFDLHDSIAPLSGATTARRLLVTRAKEYLDSLSQESSGDTVLQRELATAYDRLGDVMGNDASANLGNFDEALENYRKALAIREAVAAATPNDSKIQLELAGEYFRVADKLQERNDFDGALEILRNCVTITDRLAAGSQDPQLIDFKAGSYFYTGKSLNASGRWSEALTNFQKAASIHETIPLSNERSNLRARTHLAGDYGGMARAMLGLNQPAAAALSEKKVFDILADIARRDPNNATVREYLGEAYSQLGSIQLKSGDRHAALKSYRQARSTFAKLAANDPANWLARVNLAWSYSNIGYAFLAMEKPQLALPEFQNARSIFEAKVSDGHQNGYDVSGLTGTYSDLGAAYAALASLPGVPPCESKTRWASARSWYEKSLSVWNEQSKAKPLLPAAQAERESVVKQLEKCNASLRKLSCAAYGRISAQGT